MKTVVRTTTWPEDFYHQAYQGAKKYYNLGKEGYEKAYEVAMKATLEQANAEDWSNEFRQVCDWIYALKKTEEIYLSRPFQPWTLQDFCLINSWLTRLTAIHPGTFREEYSHWELRIPDRHEKPYLDLLEVKYHLQMTVGYHEYCDAPSDNHPWILAILNLVEHLLPKLPETALQELAQLGVAHYLGRRLTDEEQAYLKRAFVLFPPPQSIPALLEDVLQPINHYMLRLDEVPNRQELATSIGAILHYELVRIHPFEEAHKRLGRLCMNSMRMQEGGDPLYFRDEASYRRALMYSLYTSSCDPFCKFVASIAHPPKVKNCCTYCDKDLDSPKRCGNCKKALYCNRHCQHLDWQRHKQVCTGGK